MAHSHMKKVRLSKLYIFSWHNMQKKGNTSDKRDYTPFPDTICRKGSNTSDKRDYSSLLAKKIIITYVNINNK